MTFEFQGTAQFDRSFASGQRALVLAAASGDIGTQVQANIYLGQVYFGQGDYRQAMDFFRRAMAALEGERLYEFFGETRLPAVHARTYLALCLAEVGAFAEGIAVGEAALRLAETITHPKSLVTASWGVCGPYLRQGDLRKALPVLERALGLCQEADLLFDVPIVAEYLGPAYVLSGRVDDAVSLLERAVEQATNRPRLRFALSEAYLLAGRIEEASTLIDRALDRARTYKRRGHEADALHLLGDIALHPHPPDVRQAEVHYRQALALAEALGMRPLQAHCHRGLGTLYATTGQPEQARRS